MTKCSSSSVGCGPARTGRRAVTTGCESLIEQLGSEQFARLRLGVGRGDARRDLADHVLAQFDASERETVTAMITRGADAVESFVADGIEAVMNRFNGESSKRSRSEA